MALGRLIILWTVALLAFLTAFFLRGMSFWASVGIFYLAGFAALAVMFSLFLISESRCSAVRNKPLIDKQTA